MGSIKSQAQVLTISMMILVALVGIALIWQIIFNIINVSSEKLEEVPECISIRLLIERIEIDTDSILVKREYGSGNLKGIKVLRNDEVLDVNGADEGTDYNAVNVETQDSVLIPLYSIDSGDRISIAAVVGVSNRNWVCDVSDTKIA